MKSNGIELNFEHLLEILVKKLVLWLEDGVAMLPNIVIAILVVFLFFFLGKFTRKIVHHGFLRITNNRTIAGLIAGFLQVTVVAIGVFMALGVLNLDKAVASLLAGVGVLGLAVGFAFQEIASNFISGIFIAMTKPYNLGDVVEVNGTNGTVDEINLRTTSLRTDDGQQVDIPNKSMFTSQLKNFTTNQKQRLILSFNISYKSDLARAKEIALAATKSVAEKYPNLKTDIYYVGANDFGAKLSVYYWIPIPANFSSMQLTDELIISVKTALQQNQIAFGSSSAT